MLRGNPQGLTEDPRQPVLTQEDPLLFATIHGVDKRVFSDYIHYDVGRVWRDV